MQHQRFLLFRIYQYQDTNAFAELYDIYYPRIRRYVHFRLPASEDVDELTAEVFLRGWEYATSSRVEQGGALFYRIAKNLIADFYRARVHTEELSEDLVSKEGQYINDEIDARDQVGRILVAIKELKEEYQDILVMRFIDEMSVKEISEALEKTPNTIRVLLHRARKALEQKLK